MKESQNLVYELLKDAKLGKALRQPKPAAVNGSGVKSAAIGTPPRSPQKGAGYAGTFSPTRRPLSRQGSLFKSEANEKQQIPTFYRPGGEGLSEEVNAGKGR